MLWPRSKYPCKLMIVTRGIFKLDYGRDSSATESATGKTFHLHSLIDFRAPHVSNFQCLRDSDWHQLHQPIQGFYPPVSMLGRTTWVARLNMVAMTANYRHCPDLPRRERSVVWCGRARWPIYCLTLLLNLCWFAEPAQLIKFVCSCCCWLVLLASGESKSVIPSLLYAAELCDDVIVTTYLMDGKPCWSR